MRGSGRLAFLLLALSASAPVAADTWRPLGDEIALGEHRFVVHAPHRPLLSVEGAEGALRFDGSTIWAETVGPVELPLGEGLMVEAWVALASPPVENAAILHLDGGPDAELRLAVDPWLQPEFRIGPLRAASFEALPLGRWVHLAATFDGSAARLYVDGALAGESEGAAPDALSGIIAIGQSRDGGMRYDVHRLGVWNGSIAGLGLHAGETMPPDPGPPPGGNPVAVPRDWFAGDQHRPRFHPMPPAGWTNEPHALTHRDGLWHLYHQANPNGAFWEHIVWGHLVSADLVSWEARLPALIPSTGFDRRGIWVGNRIPDTDPPAILYTGVDGTRSGLGRAAMEEDGAFLRDEGAVAYGTPPGYQDMRDPWIVRTEDGWLALIGSGTLEHDAPLILAWTSSDAVEWDFVGEFDTGGAEMPGEYWELPVLRPIGDRWLLMGTPVIADARTRTLYWIGTFDGTRFTPDDPEPRSFDLFGTLLAPTLASDGDRLVAIGVIPDEGQRPEPVRQAAGWVHALGPAMEIALCPDRPGALCAGLPQEVRRAFGGERLRLDDRDLAEEPVEIDLGPDPVMLRAEIDVDDGSSVEITLRLTPDGSEATRLILHPDEGEIVLDNRDGSRAPWARSDEIVGTIPSHGMIALDLVFDGAVVSGTIAGRPLGAMLYPESREATRLRIRSRGAARLVSASIAGR
jgi:sucrose-6-phosphate hydrolase SacC (GH32 family)